MERLNPYKYWLLFLFILIIGVYFSLPSPLFNKSTSTLLLDRDGELLSARLAKDDQWRFPQIDSVPIKIKKSILLFEDEYFFYHPGVNPFSIGRAIWQNFISGKVISGGSTLSMQVIRLSRENPTRTYVEKIWEIYLALRLELSYSKEEILNLYAGNAPYGGNIVGIESASWRYFNRPPHNLSWSESAMLAVLPNSPSMIRPGKNRDLLKAKRNRLLQKLRNKNLIDSMTFSLSIMEEIPLKPSPLPNNAYHLLDKAISEGKEGKRILTSLDANLQNKVNRSINRYVKHLSQNQIHNACAIVISLKDQKVLAYVGNAQIKETRAPYVDIIQAERSSGSILKPLLYARSFEKGLLHSSSLIKDVPITIDQFSPKNFDGDFEGVVRADKALSRSLNIPATLLLRDYGLVTFHNDLNQFGFTSINRTVDDYGLTLILGGAEVKLFDLARFYSFQSQKLNDFQNTKMLSYLKDTLDIPTDFPMGIIDIGAWWLISEALTEVQRPGIDMEWKNYSSSRKVSWKTGTSHGFRDAWALGYDKNYLIAVWVGNADGEGRPGLTGVSTAGPLLFDIFQYLPQSQWFDKPDVFLKPQVLCKQSGYLPGPNCPKVEMEIPRESNLKLQCTYHHKVLVNLNNEQVFRDCVTGSVKDTVVFKLDPVSAYYYSQKYKGDYFPLKQAESCSKQVSNNLGIVYPLANSNLIIPVNFAGQQQKVVFKAFHIEENKTIYWHLDEAYLGSTQEHHELALQLSPGKHKLLIMDEIGNSESRFFRVYVDK